MKTIKWISLVMVMWMFSACHDADYYNINPNEPSQTTPSLLLTSACLDVFYSDLLSTAYASRYLTYYERPNENINYSWILGNFSEFRALRQVKDMEDIATKSNDKNYIGLAKFFRAILFSRLTERYGDIPYSQSMKAKEGIDKPKYDTQEEVYIGILAELEEANTLLSTNNGAIGGDVIYKGDIMKWKRAVNAFTLRTLIHLSKKENNTNLNIKQRFAKIVGDAATYPLMRDNSDNTQLTFNKDLPSNYYPLFNNNSASSLVSIEKGFADMLIARRDPRLFSIAEPIKDKAPNVYENYAGVNAGDLISIQLNTSTTASPLHRRYLTNEVAEPMVYLSFSEQEFNIAEAIQRGWITGPGTAQGRYNAAVRLSMQFYGIGGVAIEGYLGRPNVKFNAAEGLRLIAEQKYLAMFFQGGWEPFYEQRRTGIPIFNVGPNTLNGGKIPKRWALPQSEIDYNSENLKAALSRQFNGEDDVNGIMWLLQ
jgi:hypothetical protein